MNQYFEPKEGFSYGYPTEDDINDNNITNQDERIRNLLQSKNKWPKSHNNKKQILNELFLKKVNFMENREYFFHKRN